MNISSTPCASIRGEAGAENILRNAGRHGVNLRRYDDDSLGVALDETTCLEEVDTLLHIFAGDRNGVSVGALAPETPAAYAGPLRRTTPFLEHPVFRRYRSETEMMRYLQRLASRDLSLTTSMIPLGSCTMKLNAAAELLPITLPGFSEPHPYVPADQAEGYTALIEELDAWLSEITGFARTFFQPNSGASGEYTGLLVIKAWHESRGEGRRTVCLIPESAHGTNPASAVMAGMQVVVVKTDEAGNVDVEALRHAAETHSEDLAALMITYPSTHGVFEEDIREIIDIVHEHGGQVYLDGANMNAQVGLCRPGDFGADVCHLNLHKTFCIPHGGGGPGMGPICVAGHLAPFLPGSPLPGEGDEEAAVGPVAAAPYGSANILVISWAYIAMMGPEGLARATKLAILNANYMMARLEKSYPVLYKGAFGRCAHEFLLDLRPFSRSAGISERDVAKRLMDYGFPCADRLVPRSGYAYDRADGERDERRTGSFLRGARMYPGGDPANRGRRSGPRAECTQECPAYGAHGHVRYLGVSVQSGNGGFSGAMDPRAQVLAFRGARRRCLRGSQSCLFVSADRRIRRGRGNLTDGCGPAAGLGHVNIMQRRSCGAYFPARPGTRERSVAQPHK